MSKAYEYTGVLYKKLNAQLFKSGSKKQTVVVCDDPDSKYPNYIAVDFWATAKRNDIDQISRLIEGEGVTVKFYPNASESQKNPGSWFSSNRGIEINPTIPHGDDIANAGGERVASKCSDQTADSTADDLPF